MKKTKWAKTLMLSMALTLGTGVYSASASTVTPVQVEGNKPAVSSEYSVLKIDPTVSGTYTDGKLTIQLFVSEDKKTITWYSNMPIRNVFVKGGPRGNLYEYKGYAYDCELTAPPTNGGQCPEISHVSFYYNPNDPCF